jgi:hypothetical protein
MTVSLPDPLHCRSCRFQVGNYSLPVSGLAGEKLLATTSLLLPHIIEQPLPSDFVIVIVIATSEACSHHKVASVATV